jgi:hypothetical protein
MHLISLHISFRAGYQQLSKTICRLEFPHGRGMRGNWWDVVAGCGMVYGTYKLKENKLKETLFLLSSAPPSSSFFFF